MPFLTGIVQCCAFDHRPPPPIPHRTNFEWSESRPILFLSLSLFFFPFTLDMSSCAAVLESLSKLSITPKTTSHESAADNKTWSTALSAANPGFDYQVTKTLILKPKTAKSATPTPVVAIALDATETNVTALGKKLGLKECRFANEDFLQGTFAVAKDAGR